MSNVVLALFLAAVLPAEGAPPEGQRAFDKGNHALGRKRPEEARRHYLDAVRLDRSHARAWFALGRLESAAGESAAARQSFEAAIHADANLFEAYIALAKLMENSGDWKPFVALSEQWLKRNSIDYPLAYLYHAAGSYHLGNKAAADTSLRAAQEIDPERGLPESWRLRGLLMAERGDFAGAAAQWREYLAHVRSWPEAREVHALLADAETRVAAAAPTGATFRAETELALVRFQVRPKRGVLMADLRPGDFEIREDGVPQKTALFEGGRFYPRSVPLVISLLFDASGSVQSAGNLNPYVFHENLLEEYENASIAIFGFSKSPGPPDRAHAQRGSA
jgi:tetratricopeptide (TPR) repeat protein